MRVPISELTISPASSDTKHRTNLTSSIFLAPFVHYRTRGRNFPALLTAAQIISGEGSHETKFAVHKCFFVIYRFVGRRGN